LRSSPVLFSDGGCTCPGDVAKAGIPPDLPFFSSNALKVLIYLDSGDVCPPKGEQPAVWGEK